MVSSLLSEYFHSMKCLIYQVDGLLICCLPPHFHSWLLSLTTHKCNNEWDPNKTHLCVFMMFIYFIDVIEGFLLVQVYIKIYIVITNFIYQHEVIGMRFYRCHCVPWIWLGVLISWSRLMQRDATSWNCHNFETRDC